MTGWPTNLIDDDVGLAAILREAKTVAVLGAKADSAEPAYFVPAYLHAREILALPWQPKAVWFQLGIRNDAAAEMLARAGIRVVQNRCMMPEHRRLLGAT